VPESVRFLHKNCGSLLLTATVKS